MLAGHVSHKHLFSRFLSAAPERIHFAAHSHHYWPDVSFDAQQRAWLDAARLADRKWDVIFGDVMPNAAAHVARVLDLPDAKSLSFAPNTHEFLVRLMSSLPTGRPHRVLTTDGEFHSCARQLARLEEDGLAQVTRVPTQPFATFPDRFAEAAKSGSFDLVYVSHVFFDSGFAIADLDALVASVQDERALVVIDGYHGFCAVPTSLARIAHRAFYLAGGYKYAMSGEGVCFLHCPPTYAARPRITGWFAAFGAVEEARKDIVPYGPDGARMMGATFDPTGLYRMAAVLEMLERESLSISRIHAHVLGLQETFVAQLRQFDGHPLGEEALLVPMSEKNRGHFLTYRLDGAKAIHERLLAANVVTDVRGDRLRFGFGVYHDADDVMRGAKVVAGVLGGSS